jgi:hypothetical protein
MHGRCVFVATSFAIIVAPSAGFPKHFHTGEAFLPTDPIECEHAEAYIDPGMNSAVLLTKLDQNFEGIVPDFQEVRVTTLFFTGR